MNPAALHAKHQNLRRILRYMVSREEVTRLELSEAFRLSTATVTNLVSELLERELVYEGRQESAPIGRRATLLRFNGAHAYVLCVEMPRDTALNMTVCDLLGEPQCGSQTPLDLRITEDRPAEVVVEALIARICEYLAQLAPELREKLYAVALSVNGMVDNSGLIQAPVYNWQMLNLAAPLRAAVKLPVLIDNLTRVKAMYEMQFAQSAEENTVYVNLTPSVGVANNVNGTIVAGRHGISGEAGHMTVDYRGPECVCGNRGCLELYCGRDQILRRAKMLLTPENSGDVFYRMVVEEQRPVTFDTLFAACKAGSACVQELLGHVTEILGAGIANLYYLYDPDRMIVSGYGGDCDGALLENVKQRVRLRTAGRQRCRPEILPARLNSDELYRAISAFVLRRYLDQAFA